MVLQGWTDLQTPKKVIHLLVDTISKNGNLRLNFPLPASGELDIDEVRVLEGVDERQLRRNLLRRALEASRSTCFRKNSRPLISELRWESTLFERIEA